MEKELIKKANEEIKQRSESTPADANEGVQPKAIGLINKGSDVAEMIEKANAEARKILEEQKEFTAKQMLAGRANAGSGETEKTQEDKDKEQADSIIANYQ